VIAVEVIMGHCQGDVVLGKCAPVPIEELPRHWQGNRPSLTAITSTLLSERKLYTPEGDMKTCSRSAATKVAFVIC
jgi:hypothetical protein